MGALRRFMVRRPSHTTLCNMAVILAAVAAGFDIRTANSAAHPRISGANNEEEVSVPPPAPPQQPSRRFHPPPPRDPFIGHRRDAYLSAVRDNFIEPESEFNDFYSSSSGYPHNTYHGMQTRYRPSVNFDVPMQFRESVDPYRPPSDSHTTPSTTGSVSPRKSSRSSDNDDMALISLSPSTDKAFNEYQRQMSDTSSSVFETPKTTPKTTPQRYSVKFEDGIRHSPSTYSHRRSPSNTSSVSNPFHDPNAAKFMSPTESETGIPVLRPPPRRQSSSSDIQVHGTPERPVTLDIIPRPRPHVGILKRTSPVHIRSSPRGRGTPTPSDSILTGSDDASYVSARSAPSPGSTPPHIDHRKTLLDIDMDGQKNDGTAPLPAKREVVRQPTITELEKEFLQL